MKQKPRAYSLTFIPLYQQKNKNCLSRRKALFRFRREALRRRSFSASFKEAKPTFMGAERPFSFGGRADVSSGSGASPFARATRVNERSELILFLFLNLPLTLLLLLTLLLTLLFSTPSIVSPFPFSKRDFRVLKKL